MNISALLGRKNVLKVTISSVRNLKFLSETYNKNIVSLKKKINNVGLPERFKGTVVEKWSFYWKELYTDYFTVACETVNNAKRNPKTSSLYFACFSFLLYCGKTNPTESSFRDAIVSATNSILLVNKNIRNPNSNSHLTFIESCYNEGLVRIFSFGILSIVWIDDYDYVVGLYKAKCSYLQPQYVHLFGRVVDVGFLNKWWIIKSKMKNYDVNPNEWQVVRQ